MTDDRIRLAAILVLEKIIAEMQAEAEASV